MRVEWLDQVDSTQVEARSRVVAGLSEPLAIAAREQTGGYGRHGRVWQSPAGGLWMTVAIPTPPTHSTVPGVMLGAACARIVEAVIEGRASVSVKWPNDVLIEGRKVCGILCESFEHAGARWLLTGVGMNVNNTPDTLPGHLRRPAAALIEWMLQPIDLVHLAQRVANDVARAVREGTDGSMLSWAATHLWKLDETILVRFAGGRVERAILRGLDEVGNPMIETQSGRARLESGATLEDEPA